ncbi:hypothetical protein P5673_026087, partial [Acropora cervicornis]
HFGTEMPQESQTISMRTNLKPVTEDSPVDTQDSGYGSLQQSFDIDDHSQETGDKCGKRASPTSSSSPSESCKFKRTKDAFDKDDSAHVKVKVQNVTSEQIVKSLSNVFKVSLKIQFICLPWKAAFLKWISQQEVFATL